MNVLALIERLEREPWPRGQFAARLAQALADRGHRVTVGARFCEHDAAPAELRTIVGLRSARRIEHDVSLSLSATLGAEVWAPIIESSVEALSPRAATKRRRFLGEPTCIGPIEARRVRVALATDPRRADRLAAGRSALAGRTRVLGWASSLAPGESAPRDELRRTARAALGIARQAPVALFVGGRRSARWSSAAMSGFSEARRALPPEARLIMATPSSLSASLRAHRFGVEETVIATGPTRRLDALLCACDAAVALGGPDDESVGRFVADALRFGRPVTALRRAAGSDLLAPGADQPVAPGVLFERAEPDAIRRALCDLLSPPRLSEASAAAEGVGASLGLDSLAERLEAHLEEVAAKRAGVGRGNDRRTASPTTRAEAEAW